MQVIAHQRAAVIKLKEPKKPDIWSLPFTNRKERSLWALPAIGGYDGGYKTGSAMALVFLKYMRGKDTPGHELTIILEAIFRRIQGAGGPKPPLEEPGGAYASLRGQYVGFFNTVTGWVWTAATRHGDSLDELSDADLVAQANDGLRCDEAEVNL
ncbi:MAG: hypothetical protein NVV73_10040 [Cellvibrionaceae bacterium]|nr:hypothetical protein [Cellvibrionaceae bacterium]